MLFQNAALPLEDISRGQPALICEAHTSSGRLSQIHARISQSFRVRRHDDAIAPMRSAFNIVRDLHLPDDEARKECKTLLQYAKTIRDNAGENFAENSSVLDKVVRDVEAHLASLPPPAAQA